MQHCDPCSMPEALVEAGNQASYSLVKHAIIGIRSCWDKPDDLDVMRARHEAIGTQAVFEAALQCNRCAEGMFLLVDGEITRKVGGDVAVGITPK